MNNNLHDVLKNILLKEDKEHKYLIGYIEQKSKRSKNLEINKYTDCLADFFSNYDIELTRYKQLIAYNYFWLLSKFYEYISLNNYSQEYLEEYRIFAIRTMELSFILQKNSIPAVEIFFNKKEKDFYKNLMQIYKIDFKKGTISLENKAKVLESTVKLGRDKKKEYKENVWIEVAQHSAIDSYKSMVNMSIGFVDGAKLYSYLRLEEVSVRNVYDGIEAHKRNAAGIGGRGFILKPLDSYYGTLIKKNLLKNINNNDEFYEWSSRRPSSFLTDKGDDFRAIKDISNEYNKFAETYNKITTKKEDNKNAFKKYKLSSALGHLQAKANLNIASKYTIPKIELLAIFLKNSNDKSFEYNLLVLSMVLGIEYKNIVAILLDKSDDFKIVNKIFLRIKLTTAYAGIKNQELFRKSKKEVEVELPEHIVKKILNMKEQLYDRLNRVFLEQKELFTTEDKQIVEECKSIKCIELFMNENLSSSKIEEIYEELFNKISKSFSSYIEKSKKGFNKTIVINSKSLHLYSFYYFKQFYNGSEINHLFLKNKTANIHTKLAYVNTTKYLLNMSVWLNELSDELALVDTRKVNNYKIESDYSGSNKYISAQVFKMFLQNLMDLEFKTIEDNVSIRMIYLRYVFSVLFATREYYFSANVMDYSKRLKILFIHEKAKNLYSSKRIIPVTDLGDEYIRYFLKLKNKHNLQSFSPYVPLTEEYKKTEFDKHATNNMIVSWFLERRDYIVSIYNEEKYDAIYNFVSSVELNFGRHIFASEAHNFMSMEQDYVDALLNHFEKGTQEQGKYSLFDNQEYFKSFRVVMQKIEKDYIPFFKYLKEVV
ncbi:MAG: hypothetical protein DRG78_07505 [Epsilonproteobacteria bacterium]|nr:MAG: hypothetical protein DRG78_07505 [Campylobacterota bacterium]